MDKLISVIKKNSMLRSSVHLLKKNRQVYLIGRLLLNDRVRNAYFNYIFKRKEKLNSLLQHGPLPRNLYIELTNICNAKCIFCGYPQLKRPKITMSMDLFKNVIDQYIDIGGTTIGFTPIVGDPLMDKFLLERIDYIEEKDQIKNMQFYTNGIALSKDKVDGILNCNRTAFNLNISFGGHDRKTFRKIMGVDKFDAVEKNLIYLLNQIEKKSNPAVIIKIDYRCSEENASGQLFKLLKRSKELGLIKHDTLDGVFDNFGGLVKEETIQEAGLKLNFGFPKIGPCDIFFTKPIVLADGRVNACAERDLETSLIIGDLKTDSLSEILNGKARNNLINMFYNNKLPEVCDKCSVYQSIYDDCSKAWKKNLNWTVNA